LAGLGRKEFNSGDILLASEVQGYLQDQAVMVFDDATARGSAIPSPSEGMLTYNKDTSGLELYDGSAFGPVGSDSGLIHIETLDFSAVSAAILDDVFSAAYKNYRILIRTAGSTTLQALNLRFRAGGTPNTTSNYQYQNIEAGSTSVSAIRVTGQSILQIGGVETGAASNFIIDVFRPFDSTTDKQLFTTSQRPSPVLNIWAGRQSQALSFDGFQITPATGTITGLMSVYGYKD
jgi:hypothetical protein